MTYDLCTIVRNINSSKKGISRRRANGSLHSALHRGAICLFLFRSFITAIVVNTPERRLAKCTFVHCVSVLAFEYIRDFCPELISSVLKCKRA